MINPEEIRELVAKEVKGFAETVQPIIEKYLQDYDARLKSLEAQGQEITRISQEYQQLRELLTQAMKGAPKPTAPQGHGTLITQGTPSASEQSGQPMNPLLQNMLGDIFGGNQPSPMEKLMEEFVTSMVRSNMKRSELLNNYLEKRMLKEAGINIDEGKPKHEIIVKRRKPEEKA